MKELVTQRLVLRPFTMDDLELGFRVELNAHPDWPGYATVLYNDTVPGE